MATLFVENSQTSNFLCSFPDCQGVCCHNGRPPVEEGEAARIEANLAKFTPRLRAEARKRVVTLGFLSRRRKEGRPAIAVVAGACVFFNNGCVLHSVGQEEGDRWRYKPWRCIAFPLDKTKSGNWYVRQHGLHGEAWDLHCIDGHSCQSCAVDNLRGELEFLSQLDTNVEAWRFGPNQHKAEA